MIFLLLFLSEFIILFFVSRLLTRLLSEFLIAVTKSSNTTVNLLSFLFLPGVIIHELSHMLIAGILFVRVGDVEFVPKIIQDANHEGVKLGSVAISKTDPLRRAIIGVAPIFVGLAIVLAITYVITNNNLTVLTIPAIKVILFYLLFAVANTMFSSKKDLEGTMGLALAGFLVILTLYFLGVRIPFGFLIASLSRKEVLDFLKQQNMFLLIPLTLDALAVGLIKIIKKRSY